MTSNLFGTIPSSQDEDLVLSKQAVMTREGLKMEMTNQDDQQKIQNVSLSNSFISALQQCPAKAAADKWLLKDILPDDPLSPMVLGSAFHKVMEVFFHYQSKDRTVDGIRLAFDAMLKDKDLSIIGTDEKALHWVQNAVNKYWTLGLEDPKSITIPEVTIHHDGKYGPYDKTEVGLELFIDGQIGQASRKTLGFIDRLIIDPDSNNNEFIVDDWKTGKKASDYLPKIQKFPDFGYVRQQVLYSMMMEQAGFPISKARLIYPIAKYEDPTSHEISNGHVSIIDVHRDDYREQAVKDVEEADRTINVSLETNTWECSSSPLCSWCPLVNVCPAAFKLNKANAVEARKNAPTPAFYKTHGIVAST
jgi:putative RecB family exonuclease